MRAPRICVAGIEPATGRHIRPITGRSHPLTRDHLRDAGGPFQLGAAVELGRVTAAPSAPETEDHWFTTDRARLHQVLEADEYLQLIDNQCGDSLEEVLGPALERREWKYAVDAGSGESSLGCLRVRRRPDIEISSYGRVQLRLNDSIRPAFAPVTDLRLFGSDHETPLEAAIEDLRRRMGRGVQARLMVGLARAFVASGDNSERHWLQVNGICMEDRPLGDLP
jgi:hypothetical protein